MVTEFVLLLVGAYLLGSVPAAYLAARWSRGVDIRQYGSGNVGASNLLRLGAKWMAILVIIFDLCKGMVAVWAAQLIGLEVYQQVMIGIAAIVGHNWPVFLRFNGGRGLLTTLGVAFILPLINGPLIPWGIVAFLACAGVGLLIIHNIAVGTGSGIAAMPLASWIANEPLAMTLGFLAMFLILIIRRLTTPKTPDTASVPTGQLLLNRLLFDRDIRDKEVWIHRQPLKQKGKQGEG
ncbi:MAG: glycerol-3-phosphate acyltransferase [Dehalococcoidales bacterium]|nr:glycerol-3-phosphate acyltransferase [Dehalococcoidales bacterium]